MAQSPDLEFLARRVADAITGLTERLWDAEARARLAERLRDPEHHKMARRWLDTVQPEISPGPCRLDHARVESRVVVEPWWGLRLRWCSPAVLVAPIPPKDATLRG
jgi:hypothetical protein